MSDTTNTPEHGPGPRPAYEIGCGAVVIRTRGGGPAVCLKLDRIGKEYVHHYVIALEPATLGGMELIYVDPEEELFDCFATLEWDYGPSSEGAPDVGHAFENRDGHFLKVIEDPKSQKMFGFVEPATGLVRLRQERHLKGVHKDWKARAKLKEEVLELAELLERFAAKL